MSAGCWATPLTEAERTILAVKLGRACRRFYAAARVARRTPWAQRFTMVTISAQDEFVGLMSASADMSDLHLDVTERAA